MDPPSANEEIPEPKPKLEPESPDEKPPRPVASPSASTPAPAPAPAPVAAVSPPPAEPPAEEPPAAKPAPAPTSPPHPTPVSPTKQPTGPILDTIDAAVAAHVEDTHDKEPKETAPSTTTNAPPATTPTPAPAPSPTTNGTTTATTSTPTPPPPPPQATSPSTPSTEEKQIIPLSPAERTTSFDELRSYEAKRRSIYLKKLKSSSLYWRAFRDTLSKSYQETERAEVIMQGALVANKSYADFLSAAAEDRLDYSGRPLEDKKKAKKFQSDRLKKYDTLGSGSLLWNVAARRDEQEKRNREKLEAIHANGGGIGGGGMNLTSTKLSNSVSFDGLTQDSLLTSFIESHSIMAEKFQENYTFIKEVALEKTTSLRKELESEVNVMSMMGDATIFELEKAEDDVQKAWGAYYSIASMNVGSSTTARLNRAKNDKHAILDVWLVEMHYRMSVAYLTTIWEKCSAELSNLFASMKELECNRRFRLAELMILYQQRAERLWLSIPSIVTGVTKDLVSTPTDTDSIEKEVQSTIREKAQTYQKKDTAQMKSDPMNAPGLAGVPDLRHGYELQSPLMSDLLGKAQVIWRKNDTLMSIWKPTLGIATSDCYLHLFDIPHYANVQSGTAPEVAFQALVPPVKIPTEEDLINGNYPYGTNWYDNLVPTDSIDLSVSKITFSESKGNSTFELTETLPPNKLSTLSNHVRKKKLSLRMYSSQHMVEWLLTMKNYGAE